MTMINCLVELLRSGGDYLLLRKLLGPFRATLGTDSPLYNLARSRGESLVSFVISVSGMFLGYSHFSSFFIFVSFGGRDCDGLR